MDTPKPPSITITGTMLSNYAIYGIKPAHQTTEYRQSAYFCVLRDDGTSQRCAALGEPTKYQHLSVGGSQRVTFTGTEIRNIGALSYLIVESGGEV